MTDNSGWADDVQYSDDDADANANADEDEYNIDYGSDDEEPPEPPANRTTATVAANAHADAHAHAGQVSRDLSELRFSIDDDELNSFADGLDDDLPNPMLPSTMAFQSEISSMLDNPFNIVIASTLILDNSEIGAEYSDDDEAAVGLKINHFQLSDRTQTHSIIGIGSIETETQANDSTETETETETESKFNTDRDNNNNNVNNTEIELEMVRSGSAILGEGGFATVYRAIDTNASKLVALKVMSKKTLRKQFMMKSKYDAENPECPIMLRSTVLDAVKIELQLMLKMKHSNIVSLDSIIDDPEHDSIYIAMEYSCYGQVMDWNGKAQALKYMPNKKFMHGQSQEKNNIYIRVSKNVPMPWWSVIKNFGGAQMDAFIDRHQKKENNNKEIINAGSLETWDVLHRFKEAIVKQLFLDCVHGVQYLHSSFIIHRDLKPENLLLFANNCVKISDFGTAEQFESSDAIIVDTQGTYHFWSPTTCLGSNRNAYCDDVWALGIVLFIFIFSTVPFHHPLEYQLFRLIEKEQIQLPAQHILPASDEVRHLILALLEKEDGRRIKIDEIEQHAWFK